MQVGGWAGRAGWNCEFFNVMDAQTKRVLEYEKILALAAKEAHWEPGAQLVYGLLPAEDIHEVNYRQQQVAEAKRLYDEAAGIGAGGLEDCREAIVGAERGRALSPLDLVKVSELCMASRKTGHYLRDRAEDYPLLADRALAMPSFSDIENKINSSISQEGQVLDSASARLRQLRQEAAILQGKVQDHLNRILRGTDFGKMLQEPIITVRAGRCVLPVKSEYRSAFPGLVIDQSASGATVFMEPFAVVEMGNRARTAAIAVEHEIEAILSRLSGLVGQQADALLRAHEELAWFDAYMALASYYYKIDGIMPEVSEKGSLRLVEARHPLLVYKLGDKTVPISCDMTADIDTLVVTGPNTGGKTVTLKTIGLSVMLALAGLPIPAKAGTVIPFMDQIWADIGDEQSISQNLSTFSAHIAQILRILPEAGPRTMVLLDELGAGTDPSEGSALGKALLEHLHAKGTLTIVTTHLSELKVFASKTPGFSNAAVEFDSETLAPTYRLIMGIPGRSNALRIAHRLGLPNNIERRAREHLGEHHVEVEGLLDELEQERDSASRLGEKLQQENLAAEKLRAEYEEKLKEAELEKDIILEDAGKQAKTFLDDARSRVHGLLRSIREHLAELERLKRRSVKDCQKAAEELAQTLLSSDDLEIFASLSPVASKYLASALLEAARRRFPDHEISRAALGAPSKGGDAQTVAEVADKGIETSASAAIDDETAAEDLPVFQVDDEEKKPEPEDLISVSETPVRSDHDNFDKNARESVRAVEAEIADLASQAEAHIKNAEEKRAVPDTKELVPGCRVYVHSFGQEGTIVKIGAKRLEVQMGVIRMQVKPSDVEVIAPPEEQKSEIGQMPESRKDKLSIRVDLQGKTVDEAIYELSYRIDEAYLNNIEKLEIIHGKGTGTLRRAITEYVKQHPMVAEYRLGEVYEGGLGVTVVRLK